MDLSVIRAKESFKELKIVGYDCEKAKDHILNSLANRPTSILINVKYPPNWEKLDQFKDKNLLLIDLNPQNKEFTDIVAKFKASVPAV